VRKAIMTVVACSLLVTACSSPPSPAPVAAQPAAATPQAADPSAEAIYAAKMAVEQHLNAALPTPAELDAIGLSQIAEPRPNPVTENNPFHLVKMCGESLPTESSGRHAQTVQFSGEHTGVSVQIGQFEGVTGADAIAEVEHAVGCGTSETRGGDAGSISGAVPLPPTPGADAQYAFCQNWTGSSTQTACYLLVAKGNYASVADISVYGDGNNTVSPSLLSRVAALLTTALARA
jgi:hypothetical protein